MDKGLVVGIDEAGRGSLAGPVVAAVVARDKDLHIEGVCDSKVLKEPKREQVFHEITQKWPYAVGLATPLEIDRKGIKHANHLAILRAIQGFSQKIRRILIDGNDHYEFDYKTVEIIRGDARVECIAAASVVAKVTRDKLMCNLSKIYPDYLLQKHKGYGSAKHIEQIKALGDSYIHRSTFLTNILD